MVAASGGRNNKQSAYRRTAAGAQPVRSAQ